MTHGRIICFVFMLAGTGSLSAVEELPLSSLQYDPFVQPAFLNASASAVAKPNLQLRSTLQAGNESMVNLNGQILMIGDSYQGYQLVEVNKQSAIFIKNGEKIKVTLKQ